MVALLSMFFYFFSPEVLGKDDSTFCGDLCVAVGAMDQGVVLESQQESDDLEDQKPLVSSAGNGGSDAGSRAK